MKVAPNKQLVFSLSLCYLGYRNTLTDVFQSCHPLAIIIVKKKKRIHISTSWLQCVQLEIAAVPVEISKGNTQGSSSFLS